MTFLPAAGYGEEGHHDWDYGKEHGPRHWGDAKPEFAACKTGKTQSPIDIRGATPLHIIDNGHTIQVNYGAGSSITVGNERYDLVQFHFHKPSEEKIDGKGFPMVAHLVHKNSQGALAVVAVLLAEGSANPLVQTLWTSLPAEKEKEKAVGQVSINAAGLLPRKHGYYTFPGSLTTPPCSEGVTWFVLTSPMHVSKAQLDRFGKVYNGNARPVQPLNGRTIKVGG